MALTEEQIKAAATAAKEPTDDTDKDRGDDFVPTDEVTPEPKVEPKAAPKKEAPKKEPKKKEEPKKEPEPEEEPEEDEEPEEEDEPEEPAGKRNETISRAAFVAERNKFKERERAANARAAELEARINALEGRNKNNETLEKWNERLNGLYEEVEKARADGEPAKAAQLQRQIDQMRGQENRLQTEYIATQQALAAQQTTAYNAVVDQVESLVPELDPESVEFDEDLMEEVNDMTQAFEQRGLEPAQALRRAVKATLGRDIFKKEPPAAVAKTAPTKKTTDVGKNIKAAKGTPPDITERPERADTIDADVTKWTDEEFEKLPKATRERLRGDFV